MRKLFALIAVLGMLTIGASKLMAQEDEAAPAAQTEQTTVSIDDEQIESTSMHAAIKQKFIEGGAGFMAYQGLSRYDQGIDMVEKSVVSYGSVQMGLMEKGLTWIGLFIALAPMLGFLGTVIGMIEAFDQIQAAGDMSPALVAGGIKVALITTVGGLIVAMILQVFYNYCVSKVEGIVNNMEDASVSMLDILVKYEQKNK